MKEVLFEKYFSLINKPIQFIFAAISVSSWNRRRTPVIYLLILQNVSSDHNILLLVLTLYLPLNVQNLLNGDQGKNRANYSKCLWSKITAYPFPTHAINGMRYAMCRLWLLYEFLNVRHFKRKFTFSLIRVSSLDRFSVVNSSFNTKPCAEHHCLVFAHICKN